MYKSISHMDTRVCNEPLGSCMWRLTFPRNSAGYRNRPKNPRTCPGFISWKYFMFPRSSAGCRNRQKNPRTCLGFLFALDIESAMCFMLKL